MKLNRVVQAITFSVIVFFALSACDRGEFKNGNVQIMFSAKVPTSSSATTFQRVNESIVIEEFKINIEEIELELADDYTYIDASGKISSDDDIELKGPFVVDLIRDGAALTQKIVELDLPNAVYEEIEFEMDKGENPSSEMYRKSILIRGTFEGTPFVFWTDEEEEFEIEFDDDRGFTLEEGKNAILRLEFDLTALFDPERGGVNLANAVDGNGDGILQIFPNDPDGNNLLSKAIADRIEDIIEAFEDSLED